jgi:hypothetical protein
LEEKIICHQRPNKLTFERKPIVNPAVGMGNGYPPDRYTQDGKGEEFFSPPEVTGMFQ